MFYVKMFWPSSLSSDMLRRTLASTLIKILKQVISLSVLTVAFINSELADA